MGLERCDSSIVVRGHAGIGEKDTHKLSVVGEILHTLAQKETSFLVMLVGMDFCVFVGIWSLLIWILYLFSVPNPLA